MEDDHEKIFTVGRFSIQSFFIPEGMDPPLESIIASPELLKLLISSLKDSPTVNGPFV